MLVAAIHIIWIEKCLRDIEKENLNTDLLVWIMLYLFSKFCEDMWFSLMI